MDTPAARHANAVKPEQSKSTGPLPSARYRPCRLTASIAAWTAVVASGSGPGTLSGSRPEIAAPPEPEKSGAQDERSEVVSDKQSGSTLAAVTAPPAAAKTSVHPAGKETTIKQMPMTMKTRFIILGSKCATRNASL